MSHKILLFNVRRYLGRPSDNSSDYPGIFYLAAVLEEKGYDPWVFHGFTHEVPEIIEREISIRNIVATGFTCDFENRTAVEELSLFIKETYGFPVIIGGPQAIDLKEDFFLRSRCDYILRGEGEETFPLLMDYIVKGEGKKEDIKNLVWMDNEQKLKQNPPGKPVEDLDNLPFPAYHRSLHKNRKYGHTIFTGRGCPFSCAFCYESSHEKKIRLRSIASVIEEIKHNFDLYPSLNYIAVLDDTFTLNPQRVEEFCNEINKLRREKDFVWYCEAHIHTLYKWPEMIHRMAKSGLVRLQIGVETGNQHILDMYGKQITLEEIEAVIDETVKAGISQIATNLITGGAMESDETIANTMAFAEKLLRKAPGVIDIMTGFLRPYPGTAIAARPDDFGLTILDKDGIKSFDDFPLVKGHETSVEDIVRYRQKVNNHIFNTMKELLRNNLVPYETILSHYKNACRYGITSMWYFDFFKKNQLLDEYFRLIWKGEAVRFTEVPSEELLSWRPLRTVEIRRAVNFSDGYPKISDYVLSPLEFELLLRCSGKLNFKEVLESLYMIFGGNFKDMDEFKLNILNLINTFDKKYWVIFCKF
ncbi:MAG: radical SAM protein [Candidatus Eremiobacterota bacterium]